MPGPNIPQPDVEPDRWLAWVEVDELTMNADDAVSETPPRDRDAFRMLDRAYDKAKEAKDSSLKGKVDYFRGEAHRKMTNWKKAIFFYERALPMAPEFTEAINTGLKSCRDAMGSGGGKK